MRSSRYAGHAQRFFESLESRRHLDADVAGSVAVGVQSGPPPRVEDVHISGSAWSPDVLDYLDRRRPGNGPYGFWITTSYSQTVSWSNLNRLTIRFTHDLDVDADDLTIRGLRVPTYDVASVQTAFDPSEFLTTATFDLPGLAYGQPETLRFEVDGDPGGVETGPGGLQLDGDGDGVPGGDFVFRLSIVPGAANLAPYVDQSDYSTVRRALGRTVAAPGTALPFYNVFADFDADGRVNINDLALVRKQLYTYAPQSAPAASAVDGGEAARARPVTRGLFSAAPILA